MRKDALRSETLGAQNANAPAPMEGRPSMEPWKQPGAAKSIRVVAGKESFFPLKYQGFDVGPVEVTVEAKDGETPEELYRRGRDIANEFFLLEFEDKCAAFGERVKQARQKVEQ